jgi:2-polyprenyl-3-methyl-5-hydroxy-6-metoxy-1,4-benzoquinol methylase
MSKRSQTPEWIDLDPPCYTQEEYVDCLIQLERIGRFLGGDRATFWAFNQLKSPPASILDVGCGGGQLAIKLAKRYPAASVKGIDLSAEAIAYAHLQLKKESGLSVEFCVPSTAELNELPKSFDVVTSTLVCHHLSDEQIIEFIKKSVKVAKEAVIINDLHRHLFASYSFFALAPICFPNRLIFHDGLLSIKRAFIRNEWIDYMQASGIPQHAWSLSWHPFFRWILIIYPSRMSTHEN